MTNNEIFSKALAKMDNCFTSNEFGKRCTRLGLPHKFIANGSMFFFLLQNCERGTESKRTWYKKDAESPIQRIQVKDNSPWTPIESVLNEDSCIAYLKQLGYKILKPSFTEL